METQMNKELRKFTIIFVTILVGIILIVGFLRYEKKDPNSNEGVKSTPKKTASGKANSIVSSDTNLKNDKSADESLSENPVDTFDPLVDDNTPDDNPEEIIEDPEME